MMRQLIENFPQQLADAVSIGKNAILSTRNQEIRNVLITGLGGSGIGGKVVAQLVEDEAKVPFYINNDYLLPNFVDEHTLVIVSSYSGNTEETLAAMDCALKAGAQVAAITSGGAVLDLCKAHELTHIIIPGGQPPRSQFGYSFVQQLFLLSHYGIIDALWIEKLSGISAFLEKKQGEIIALAQGLCDENGNRIPIIYADRAFEGVAIRWRQQLNENSKLLCWHQVFPELNHNEMVGWDAGSNCYHVMILQTSFDHPRSRMRMEISKPWIEQKGALVSIVSALGENRLEQVISLIHLGDWLSLLLAEKNNTDPVIIEAIDHLKGELAKR